MNPVKKNPETVSEIPKIPKLFSTLLGGAENLGVPVPTPIRSQRSILDLARSQHCLCPKSLNLGAKTGFKIAGDKSNCGRC
jgi:hypothetical protein